MKATGFGGRSGYVWRYPPESRGGPISYENRLRNGMKAGLFGISGAERRFARLRVLCFAGRADSGRDFLTPVRSEAAGIGRKLKIRASPSCGMEGP